MQKKTQNKSHTHIEVVGLDALDLGVLGAQVIQMLMEHIGVVGQVQKQIDAVHDAHAVGHEVVAVHVGNAHVVEEGRGLGRVLEEPVGENVIHDVRSWSMKALLKSV